MSAPGTLLLSVDFEDWHQLVRRRVGVEDWDQAGPALRRQTDVLLGLLDRIATRATFFILGITARAYPDLVQTIAAAGHEIGSHGDAHRPVHAQTRAEFGMDLQAARQTIERLTGRAPVGYRAPAFSITNDSRWAYEVLSDHGFAYDASQHDSPRIRDRVASRTSSPHLLELETGRTLWEFPVAVWRAKHGRIPVGGASYWALLPETAVLRGLERAGAYAGLYLHPHEFDPQPLRPGLTAGAPIAQQAQAAVKAAQRNSARRRAPRMLEAIAERFRLIPYGEAHAQLSAGA